MLLGTVHTYCPPYFLVTVRVWVYCAVTGSLNRVIPPATVSEFLIQVTVVAGPPVVVQEKVNQGLSPLRSKSTAAVHVILPGIMTSPEKIIWSYH